MKSFYENNIKILRVIHNLNYIFFFGIYQIETKEYELIYNPISEE